LPDRKFPFNDKSKGIYESDKAKWEESEQVTLGMSKTFNNPIYGDY
jgi:hypothetical protein